MCKIGRAKIIDFPTITPNYKIHSRANFPYKIACYATLFTVSAAEAAFSDYYSDIIKLILSKSLLNLLIILIFLYIFRNIKSKGFWGFGEG